MSESASNEVTAISLLKEQVAGLQHQLQKAMGERDEYRDAMETIGTERDELATAAKTPDSKDQRIKELEGSIRTGKHRDTFAALAKKAGIRDEALGDIFDRMRSHPAEFGLDPALFDADAPEAAKYEAALVKAKETRGYAFNPAEDGEPAPVPGSPTWPGNFQPSRTPAPAGTGRGGRNSGADGTIVTAEMRADPSFMLNPANREVIMSAAKEGRFR